MRNEHRVLDTFERSLTVKGREEGGWVESFVFHLEELTAYWCTMMNDREEKVDEAREKEYNSLNFFQGMGYRT